MQHALRHRGQSRAGHSHSHREQTAKASPVTLLMAALVKVMWLSNPLSADIPCSASRECLHPWKAHWCNPFFVNCPPQELIEILRHSTKPKEYSSSAPWLQHPAQSHLFPYVWLRADGLLRTRSVHAHRPAGIFRLDPASL